MTAKRFTYEGQEWEATYDGYGVGVATGYIPKATSFSFTFRCLSDPASPTIRGHLGNEDLSKVGIAELVTALREALADG